MRLEKLFIFIVVCSLAVAATDALGAPLDLSRRHYPLVSTEWIQIDYDADGGGGGAGLFTADGWPMVYNADSISSVDLYDGVFQLSVDLDPATGNYITGTGSLLVTGDPFGTTETLFYSTNIIGFGFCAEDLFEFQFKQEGTTSIIPNGEVIGIVMDGREILGFSYPSFGADFSGDGYGICETFYMPEPSSMALLALAGVGLLRRRRA